MYGSSGGRVEFFVVVFFLGARADQQNPSKGPQRDLEDLLNEAKSRRSRAKDGSGGKEEMGGQNNVYFKRLEWEKHQVFVWMRGGETKKKPRKQVERARRQRQMENAHREESQT